MEFLELAKKRYSERRFSNRQVEGPKIAKILEAGRLAPTAHNLQPQRIYVIASKKAREGLLQVTPMTYGAPLVFLVCYDKNVSWKNTNDRCYDIYDTGEVDAAIAAVSMMMEATDLDLVTLWARAFDSRDLMDLYQLPENIVPVCLLSVGYPSAESRPSKLHSSRKDIDELVRVL